MRIAVVGAGTGDVLRAAPEAGQLDVAFTPSKARRALGPHISLGSDVAHVRMCPCGTYSMLARPDIQACHDTAHIMPLHTYQGVTRCASGTCSAVSASFLRSKAV